MADTEHDPDRAETRAAHLTGAEQVAGSDDPLRQAELILEDSDQRSEDREAAPSSFVEHRTSDEATAPLEDPTA